MRCPESGPPGRQHPRAEQSGEACGPYRQQSVGRESVEQQPHGCPQAQRSGTPQLQKKRTGNRTILTLLLVVLVLGLLLRALHMGVL